MSQSKAAARKARIDPRYKKQANKSPEARARRQAALLGKQKAIAQRKGNKGK